MLHQGGFVVSVCGNAWHSVGIDEAHEMLINRECKSSIVRPHPEYINRLARYIPSRTKALENLKQQLFPESKQQQPTIISPFSLNPNDRKCEFNIQAQVSAMKKHSLFSVDGRSSELRNPYTNKEATLQQENDLLNFRSIGEKEFLQRIKSFILKQPSTLAPNRKRHLQTFSAGQKNSRKISQLERDRRLILSAMKNKMQFSKRTGRPIDKPGEQLIELPLAISDNDGNPIKGQKSYTTKALEARYKATSPPVFTTSLPWKPQCSIVEGMFLINTTPLRSHRTLSDYAGFLMRRYLLTEFNKGSEEVHIIFDNYGRLQNTPKYFEHARRDAACKITTNHCCDNLQATTVLPKGNWQQNLLNCRVCKRNLVKFLGKFLLDNIQAHLQPQQSLYVAGSFDGAIVDTAWFVRGGSTAQPDPSFTCNAEETDTRLWLHAKQTKHTRILVLSPDTDVYHIGLPLQCNTQKQIIVQVSAVSSRQMKLLNLTELVSALQRDPDLAGIDSALLPQILQTLFVVSGCDYISFFSRIGNATFMRYFFQYASFVTAGDHTSTPGTLANTNLNSDYKTGFLAFVRLVGTVYFKKHASGFGTASPPAHFKNFTTPGLTVEQQHSNWLEDIRQNISYRVKFENEMIPSDEALKLHWTRSCWIIHMWRQADHNTMSLQPITQYGWSITNDKLTIVWDTTENMQAVRDRVKLLMRGCKCVTGCNTRCSCRRNDRQCSEGCECINCTNISVNTSEDNEIAEIALEEAVTTNGIEDKETDELMDWIFGSGQFEENIVDVQHSSEKDISY